MFPEFRTAALDLRPHSVDDLLIAHAILDPASTIVVEIQQNGHAAIDSFRETGLVRLARIELLPETDEKVARLFGSQPADPFHRFQLLSFPFFPAFVSKDELVPCVNLAEIVNEQHGYHPVDIDLQIQAVGQGYREQGDLPAVLRRVFVSSFPNGPDLSEDPLQLFDFEHELNDLSNFPTRELRGHV